MNYSFKTKDFKGFSHSKNYYFHKNKKQLINK